jgi:glycosyltransferase involved in cell wall biosynthesis
VGVSFEHIIVSDGKDDIAKSSCGSYAAKAPFKVVYDEIRHQGCYGDFARTRGLELINTDYVIFFDDDNAYFPWAVNTLYTAAYGFDIGVALIEHWDFDSPNKQIIGRSISYGQIDTACYCVHADRTVPWVGFTESGVGTDYCWIEHVSKGADVNYVPVVIASHLIEKQHLGPLPV